MKLSSTLPGALLSIVSMSLIIMSTAVQTGATKTCPGSQMKLTHTFADNLGQIPDADEVESITFTKKESGADAGGAPSRGVIKTQSKHKISILRRPRDLFSHRMHHCRPEKM